MIIEQKLTGAEALAANPFRALPDQAESSIGKPQTIHVPVSVAAAGQTVLVPPTGNSIIDIRWVSLYFSGTCTIRFFAGTRPLTGPFTGVGPAGYREVETDNDSVFVLLPGEALILDTSTADPIGGLIKYSIRNQSI